MADLYTILNGEKISDLYKEFFLSKKNIETINEIINMEWIWFDEVKGMNGRAYCQDSPYEFIIMRLSQYLVYNEMIISSILADYKNLQKEDINPVLGKYARMMEYTDNKEYNLLKDKLLELSPVKKQLISDISEILEEDLKGIENKYTETKKNTRPTETEGKKISSVEYFTSEISYLSLKTLWKIKDFLQENRDFIEKIYYNTVYIANSLNFKIKN